MSNLLNIRSQPRRPEERHGAVRIYAYTDTKDVRQGDYVLVTVVGKSIVVVGDALNQSLAE